MPRSTTSSDVRGGGGVRRSPGEGAVEDRRELPPCHLIGAQLEPAPDAADDEAERAGVDAVDENHARVGALGGGPFAQDAREVGDVVGDEDALLAGGEREDLVVVEARERRFLVERAHGDELSTGCVSQQPGAVLLIVAWPAMVLPFRRRYASRPGAPFAAERERRYDRETPIATPAARRAATRGRRTPRRSRARRRDGPRGKRSSG
jgi:hypothetical protein